MTVTLRGSREDSAVWQRPLLDLLWAIARRRTLLLAVLVVGVAGGAVQYLCTPPTYKSTADAVLLPREKPTVDLLVRSSSLATAEESAQRADSASLMLPAKPDLYISLMSSRALLERVAIAFEDRLPGSSRVRETDRADEIVNRLRRMTMLEGSEEGMLTVTVTAREPQLAADLANMLLTEGQAASKAVERQLLMQQAGYLSDAVDSARRRLMASEQALKAFSERHAVIDPEMQANDRLRQIRELTASLDRARSELARQRLSFTDADTGIMALKADIAVTDRRIVELRGQITGDVGEREYGDLVVAYEGLVQDVRFRRDLLATLSTQADVFAIRAEQPAGNIAVVRPAVAMTKPAGPSKKRIFGAALGVALVVGLGLCVLLDQIDTLRQDPELYHQLVACRTALLRPALGGAPATSTEGEVGAL